MLCRHCGHALDNESVFCVNCGARSDAPADDGRRVVCPTCGAAADGAADFCERCGSRLADARRAQCAACGAVMEADALFCVVCGAASPASGNTISRPPESHAAAPPKKRAARACNNCAGPILAGVFIGLAVLASGAALVFLYVMPKLASLEYRPPTEGIAQQSVGQPNTQEHAGADGLGDTPADEARAPDGSAGDASAPPATQEDINYGETQTQVNNATWEDAVIREIGKPGVGQFALYDAPAFETPLLIYEKGGTYAVYAYERGALARLCELDSADMPLYLPVEDGIVIQWRVTGDYDQVVTQYRVGASADALLSFTYADSGIHRYAKRGQAVTVAEYDQLLAYYTQNRR